MREKSFWQNSQKMSSLIGVLRTERYRENNGQSFWSHHTSDTRVDNGSPRVATSRCKPGSCVNDHASFPRRVRSCGRQTSCRVQAPFTNAEYDITRAAVWYPYPPHTPRRPKWKIRTYLLSPVELCVPLCACMWYARVFACATWNRANAGTRDRCESNFHDYKMSIRQKKKCIYV